MDDVRSSYVRGAFLPPSDDRRQVEDPSDTTRVVGQWSPATPAQAAEAAEAAKEAYPAWEAWTAPARGQVLFKAATLLEAERDAVATLASSEMGKPIGEMRGEVDRGVALLRYYAGEGTRAVGEVYPSAMADALLFTRRTGVGPVLLITPWNFPVAIPIWKMAPALVFGNTVVWKPAEWSSLTAVRLVEVLGGAGFPPGVINLVLGPGRTLGAALTRNPAIRAVSFTGSRPAGMSIAAGALETGARFQLEMGGKNPAIVLEDADIDVAVERILSSAMRSAGQKCTATSRVIALPGILPSLREALVERARALKQGPALDASVFLGPVVSATQRESILAKVKGGVAEGGVVLTGSEPPAGMPPGHWVPPVIVDGARPGGVLHTEELFGPVVGLFAADTAEAAVALANQVPYGLSASIFTRDLDRALYFIRHMEAGLVRVNDESAGVEYQAPFGGVKESSWGWREQGRAAIEFYTETHTVTVRPSR